MIDKAVFPRDKLCGGLLTLRSKKVFEEVFGADWGSAFEFRSTGVKLLGPEGLLTGEDNYSELFFTNRHAFDDHLLNLAKAAGILTYEGTGVKEIDRTAKVCRLVSGREISYQYLIGADRVNSIVAKFIFGSSFDKKTIGFALEMEVDRQQLNRYVDLPEVYFGAVRWGYGWVFPKAKNLTVGIGGTHKDNPDMKEDFKKFLKDVLERYLTEKSKDTTSPEVTTERPQVLRTSFWWVMLLVL